jgi:hypothetical protein
VLDAGEAEQWAGEGTNHGGVARRESVGSAGCYIREKRKGYRRRSRPAAKKKMDDEGVFGFVRDPASVDAAAMSSQASSKCNELLHTDLLTRYKLSASHTLAQDGQWQPAASTSFRDA